jgi:rhodanese-related sulfurtransferase
VVSLSSNRRAWGPARHRGAPRSRCCGEVPTETAQARLLLWFSHDDAILVSCRSGGRSAIAINQLAAAGFTNAYNILDGMEGSTVDDPESVFDGMRMKNGWKNSGLPWTYDLDPEHMLLPERESGELHQGNEHD